MEISEKLIQAIVNYLQTKPFHEVAGLIQAIQMEAQKKPSPPAPKGEVAKE